MTLSGSVIQSVRSLTEQIELDLQKSGWNGSFKRMPFLLEPYAFRFLIGPILQVKANLNDIDLLLTISLPQCGRYASLLSSSYRVLTR